MDGIESDVLAANEAFYQAFRDRNVVAMAAIWAKHAKVACMHPGLTTIIGREPVLRSFRGIMAHPNAPVIHCSGAEAHLLGTSAFVTCFEGNEGQEPRLVATNVFVLEEGRWRIAHHQAAPMSPQAIDRVKGRAPEPVEPESDDKYRIN